MNLGKASETWWVLWTLPDFMCWSEAAAVAYGLRQWSRT